MEVPAGLRANKAIAPYISRSVELETINPLISYYCKIYVLEYILNNKLHTTDKEIEAYTIHLLDDTESIKGNTDPENEGLHQALSDKNISLGIVMEFSYKIFNSCFEELAQYDGSNKPQLISKFRACLNFMNLLSIFYNKPDDRIEWAKYTGGKATNNVEFEQLNKEKLKALKFRLAQLIKDEVPLKKVDDKDLEDELERELKELELAPETAETPEVAPEAPQFDGGKVDRDLSLPTAPTFIDDESIPSAPTVAAGDEADKDLGLPSAPQFIDDDSVPSAPPVADDDLLPSPPKFIDSADETRASISNGAPNLPLTPGSKVDEDSENLQNSEPTINLPGAPHFLPDNDDDSVKLPGAPQFLPDDDISHINKDSSIKVYTPSKPSEVAKPAAKPHVPVARKSSTHTTKPEDINDIIDRSDLIAKVQKHAKFAISALNYEDIKTAEKELREGLELIKNLQ